MLLKEDDISAWSVNWEPKSQQIADIAKELNIGIDSLVFFDDSAYEINQVLSAYPEIRCIQLPAAPEQIVSVARRAAPFDKLEITADDRSRAERYAVETQRDTLRESLSLDDFIRTLEVQLDITGPTPITSPASPSSSTKPINSTSPLFASPKNKWKQSPPRPITSFAPPPSATNSANTASPASLSPNAVAPIGTSSNFS